MSLNTIIIDLLYAELICLNEIAGELDEETNAKTTARQEQIKQELIELGETL